MLLSLVVSKAQLLWGAGACTPEYFRKLHLKISTLALSRTSVGMLFVWIFSPNSKRFCQEGTCDHIGFNGSKTGN